MATELLFREDACLRTASARVVAVHEGAIELDRTVFHPMGGGQAGDSGVLLRAGGERVAIADTRKGATPDTVLHLPAAAPQALTSGETVELEFDWERRYALMRLLSVPGIDLQRCGGTHVRNTGEIGAVGVVRIRSEDKRNKRVEIALAP